MPKIRLEPLGLTLQVTTNQPLLKALLYAKVELPAVCGGEGTCGTCALQVFEGDTHLSAPTPLEQATLRAIHRDGGDYRLTCQTCLQGDEVVFYLNHRAARKLTQIFDRLKDRRAPREIYHPHTGELLVPKEGIITQPLLEKLLSE